MTIKSILGNEVDEPVDILANKLSMKITMANNVPAGRHKPLPIIMKHILFAFLSILIISISFAQNKLKHSEFRVINVQGAKVYEEPTFKSNILSELELGKTFEAEKIVETSDSRKIGKGFELNGIWIKVNEFKGYIFSSDLTYKKVETGKNSHGQSYVDFLGELVGKKSEKKSVKTENGEFSKYFEYKYYENGTYIYTSWDGCFDHVITYNNLTLSEVYHQMVSDYGMAMSDNIFWVPIFQEKSDNVIKFQGEGATQELKIEIEENGQITVSSYDCT